MSVLIVSLDNQWRREGTMANSERELRWVSFGGINLQKIKSTIHSTMNFPVKVFERQNIMGLRTVLLVYSKDCSHDAIATAIFYCWLVRVS